MYSIYRNMKKFTPHQKNSASKSKDEYNKKTSKLKEHLGFSFFGKEQVTQNSNETQKLGELLAQEIKGGAIICLEGDLGSGKTTFTQGFLKGLKVKGPYTSPTFLIIKNYKKEISNPKSEIRNKSQITNSKSKKYQIPNTKYQIQNIYHIDAYRVQTKDILSLGWEEMLKDNPPAGGNIIIVEWADRIKKIIPKDSVWIKFKWLDENKRKVTFMSSPRRRGSSKYIK
jgi:tRNA threonylcarbamoyladenosine biosynthesis protein TsaE